MSSLSTVQPQPHVKMQWVNPADQPFLANHRSWKTKKFPRQTPVASMLDYQSPLFDVTPMDPAADEFTSAHVNHIEDYAYKGNDIVLMTDVYLVEETYPGNFHFDLKLPESHRRWTSHGCVLVENYVDLEEVFEKPRDYPSDVYNQIHRMDSELKKNSHHITGSIRLSTELENDFRIACVVKAPDEVIAYLDSPNAGITISFNNGKVIKDENSYLTVAEFDRLADSIFIQGDGREGIAGEGLYVHLSNVRRPGFYYELWALPGQMLFGLDETSKETPKDNDDDDDTPKEEYPYENAKCEFYIDGKRQPKDAYVTSTDEASVYGNDVINITLNPGQDLIVPGHDVTFICRDITIRKSLNGLPVAAYIGSFVYEDGSANWYDSVTILNLRNDAFSFSLFASASVVAMAFLGVFLM